MAEFKASDGTIIRWGAGVDIEWERAGASKRIDRRIRYMADSPVDDAMAEWYQHRRDVELGRWRDPEHPDFVVYRDPESDDREGRCIRVVNEPTGRGFNFWEHYSPSAVGEIKTYEGVARAWFAAHPEPKPWHAAKHEEVWLVTANGDTGPMLATYGPDSPREGLFTQLVAANGTRFDVDDPGITAARRIWPEQDVTDASGSTP